MKITHQTKKLSDLVDIREEIHLNPSWQRGPVWSIQKKALLMDSILRGYDIPMIYLRKCFPVMIYKYEVVDGQQRLRAIWEFLDEQYALPPDYEKIGNRNIGGKSFSDLPSLLQNQITEFPVVVAIIENAREPEISRLFSRMQMGVRLEPAELRNAVQTGLRHAIDATARLHDYFINSKISAARFRHQDYLAHAFSICLHDAERDLKAPQLMDDYVRVTDSDDYGPIIAEADKILTFLNKVNLHTGKRLTQKWMFVDLFYLLFQNKDKLTKLKDRDFANKYQEFDENRLNYTGNPSVLLDGKPTTAQKNLYDYIQAFKFPGAEQKNLKQRNRVLKFHFKSLLED